MAALRIVQTDQRSARSGSAKQAAITVRCVVRVEKPLRAQRFGDAWTDVIAHRDRAQQGSP